jgi:hypothetical protein
MTTPFSAALIGVPAGTAMSMPSFFLPADEPKPEVTRPRTGQRMPLIPVALGAGVVRSIEAVCTELSAAFFGGV